MRSSDLEDKGRGLFGRGILSDLIAVSKVFTSPFKVASLSPYTAHLTVRQTTKPGPLLSFGWWHRETNKK